ncbi:hypothetical protein OIU79_030290 [Salix purpurea]|uniref:Uncharacterized protein n=1 Tax=Salix purpurea TaxID=77065 RepID=A0A9Q0V880_SALPP|nr:hypothetical protein OIU79_030290 [Salix purpurea]
MWLIGCWFSFVVVGEGRRVD